MTNEQNQHQQQQQHNNSNNNAGVFKIAGHKLVKWKNSFALFFVALKCLTGRLS